MAATAAAALAVIGTVKDRDSKSSGRCLNVLYSPMLISAAIQLERVSVCVFQQHCGQ